MDHNKKLKIYLAGTVCLIIILGLWFYSFKLNLTYGLKNNSVKNGLDLTGLKNEIADIFKKSPLTNGKNDWPILPAAATQTASTEELQKLADEMAESIKGLNMVNGTSTPTNQTSTQERNN